MGSLRWEKFARSGLLPVKASKCNAKSASERGPPVFPIGMTAGKFSAKATPPGAAQLIETLRLEHVTLRIVA
jgi:hypothetical protein